MLWAISITHALSSFPAKIVNTHQVLSLYSLWICREHATKWWRIIFQCGLHKTTRYIMHCPFFPLIRGPFLHCFSCIYGSSIMLELFIYIYTVVTWRRATIEALLACTQDGLGRFGTFLWTRARATKLRAQMITTLHQIVKLYMKLRIFHALKQSNIHKTQKIKVENVKN